MGNNLTQQTQYNAERDLNLHIAKVFLLATGLTLFALSSAYIRDLEQLRTLPGELWNAVCGRPSELGFVLPLLLTLTTLSLLGAAGAQIAQRALRRG